MNKGIILALLLAMSGLAFAIAPVENWTLVSTGKYTQTPAAGYVTEGGNVTNLDLDGNVSTEKWAGYWGDVSGDIVLAPAAGGLMFYTWAWTPAEGGEVCAVAASSGFDWATVQTIAAGTIDTIWGFAVGTDDATSTLDESCDVDVAGTAVVGSDGVTTNGAGAFQTCAVGDGDDADKEDVAFCVNIQDAATVFNGGTGDYQLLAATDDAMGATETHYFWIELD
ncbi:MAG: hypothetical protein NTY83_02310 [Candidatus Micrarchaeota archaeon]|nr:hypothetical protein [Candidatus Micrarchaeota archaeon]